MRYFEENVRIVTHSILAMASQMAPFSSHFAILEISSPGGNCSVFLRRVCYNLWDYLQPPYVPPYVKKERHPLRFLFQVEARRSSYRTDSSRWRHFRFIVSSIQRSTLFEIRRRWLRGVQHSPAPHRNTTLRFLLFVSGRDDVFEGYSVLKEYYDR